MKTAIIDLGTNTFNLLIRDSNGKVFYNDKIPVKLGKGGFRTNQITTEAMERGIDALTRFKEICRKLEADSIFAFATSAVRGSTNGDDFVKMAAEKTGIQVNVIDGDREAEFIYAGVKNALSFDNNTVLIMDVGGGSTEFVIATQNELFWKKSYPLGVARLLEKFNPNEPLSAKDIEDINEYFENILIDLAAAVRKHKPTRLIGSSGSFETLHDICALRFNNDIITPDQSYSRMYLHELNLVTEHLIKSTMLERLVLPGMLAMRADTLHISALQIQFVLQQTGIDEMFVSLFALKEGVIYSLQNKNEKWLKSL